MSLGKKITKLREQQNMTMTELAKKAQISVSYLNDIEKGRSNPSLDTLRSIAEALKVSPGYFLDDLPDDPPSDIELEELLKHSNIKFNGEPLDEEDKQDIIEFLKVAWKTIRKKKRK
ncbi:MAG: helix-turn-helix transcriptional regulator [Thermoanaerobacteraceae bacterium]|nr:helix-turn-helix transcriptional regulator [Thermoanaerobacteraceae bacterium]